ncbi:Pentatricopeptide repeat-containing protein At1g73710 [Linum perenne]
MMNIDSYSHCRSPMEMSCRSYQFAAFPECKFQSIHSPSLARVRFNQLPLNRTTSSSFQRLRCQPEPVTLATEGSKIRVSRHKVVVYRGNILSALRSLESGNSIEETLGSRNFSAREKHVILTNQKSWERVVAVFEFFKSQKDYKPVFVDYFIVLQALGHALKWDKWKHYWAEMAKSGVYPEKSTYAMLVSVFGKAGLVTESLLWIKHMKLIGYFPEKRHIDIVMATLRKAGDYDLASKIYKQWSVRIVDLDDLQFESSAYFSDVFKHFLSAEQFRTGGRVPTTPREEVASDSAKMQTSIKNAYAEKGMRAKSKIILNGRKDHGESPNMDVYKFHLELKAYGKAELYDKALSLFRSVKDHIDLPKVYSYNSIIRILSNGGLANEARNLLDEMLGEGLKPICATFVPLMLCYSRLGRLTDAVDIYQKMVLAKVKPNVVIYEALIDGFLESGDLEEALRYLRVMENESGISPGKTVLTSLIKACCKLGSVDQVKQLFEKAMTLEGGLDTNSSNTVLTFCAERTAVLDAEMVFNSMKDKGSVDDVSYETMIFMYRRIGMLEKALEVAEEMIHSSGLPDESVSYHDAIVSYLRNRQLRPAGELLHKMLNEKKKLTPDRRTLDLIFSILSNEGLTSEAVTQLQNSYEQGKPYAVQASVASVLSVMGLHGLAMEYCEAFTKANEQLLDRVAYNTAIYVYTLAGETDRALEMFTRMKDKGLEPDIVTHMNMANCYKKALEDVTKRNTQESR